MNLPFDQIPGDNLQDGVETNINETNLFEETAPSQPAPTGHDIVVIGTSAGGVEGLQRLVRDLPADLAAAVFIVMHLSPESPGLLPAILEKVGHLPVSHPKNGEIIELGHIYVASPDYHMIIDRDLIRVVRGPKENRHRPAIDPLFRSAARHYGPRVIGVILTGMLDDGTSGLLAIKRLGGLAVVQNPKDALYPDMPSNALNRVKGVDYVVSLSEVAPLLRKLVNEMPEPGPEDRKEARTVFEQLRIEDEFAVANHPPEEVLNRIGKPSSIACPECHGTLWEINDNKLLKFRCRIGHAYSVQSLLEEHSESLETALWIALRTLEESAALSRRLADQAQADHNMMSASSFMESAAESEQQAELIKKVLIVNKAVGEQKEV